MQAEIPAINCITDKRLDMVSKYLYLKEYSEKGSLKASSFIYKVYKSQIDALTNGTYTEPNTPSKNSIARFTGAFEKLFDSIRENGFQCDGELLTFGKDHVPGDGAHRLSAAAFLGLKVSVDEREGNGVLCDIPLLERQYIRRQYINFLIANLLRLRDSYRLLRYDAGGGKAVCKRLRKGPVKKDLVYLTALGKEVIGVIRAEREIPQGFTEIKAGTEEYAEILSRLEYAKDGPLTAFLREFMRATDRKLFRIKPFFRKHFPGIYGFLRKKKRG